MFPNHVGQAETPFNHFYNTHQSSSFNQTNPGMYGRHTPHVPQTPTNLQPPLPPAPPPPMMAWNGFNIMQPPHPHHQPPYNPMPNMHHQNHPGPPPNLINPPNRHQFHPHLSPLGHPFACQHPPVYGHQSPFMMPLPQFPGGEMFHQGYVTAGGPFSTHQNEGFYHHPIVDQSVRQMPNFMGPPMHQMNFSQRPPIHTQPGFASFQKPDLISPFDQVLLQQGYNTPWRNDPQETGLQNQYKPMFPSNEPRDFSQGIFESLQPPQIHVSYTTDVTNQRGYSTHNPTRTTTPCVSVLEQNTAVNFDESSDELAEIFGDKSCQNNPITSRASSNRSNSSSKRTCSSGYIFYSDDESYDNVQSMDAAMGSTKVFKDSTINQQYTEGYHQDNWSSKHHDSYQVPQKHIRPPPGFSHLKEAECPSEEQLHKVGYIIKGLLKIDVRGLTGGTSPQEVNTIRSMIDRPIYSNCESRLMRQETEIPKKERPNENVPVLNSASTGQRRYIQRITSHFRILFDPIPDMFQDDLVV